MLVQVLILEFLAQLASTSNYYPYQQEYFAHQSQSVYQGESGIGFGFHPGVFKPQNPYPGGGAQFTIGSGGSSGNHGGLGGSHDVSSGGGSGSSGGSVGVQFLVPQNPGPPPPPGIQGSGQIVISGGGGIYGGHGQGPVYFPGGGIHGGSGHGHGPIVFPGGGIHGGSGHGPILIPGGVIHGGNGHGTVVIPGGNFHGGNGQGTVVIPGGGIHGGSFSGGHGGSFSGGHGESFSGGHGWPAFQQHIHFPLQKPPCCDNNLKPSITGWDTSYTVPCGTFNIYPFVTAWIRYTAGSHVAEKVPKGQSPRRQRHGKSYPQYQPFQNFPPTTCSWNFNAVGCKLKFSCSYLQLPALFQCDENVMEYNDTQKYFKYCGSASRKVHEPLLSDSGHLKVTFKSRAFALPSVINCSVICTPELILPQSASNVLVSEKPLEVKPEPKPLKFGKCKCGIRRDVSAGRIVGGKRTSPGEFPWTVALVKKNSNRPFCGGSLINNRYILTAAHCVSTRKPGQNAESEMQVLLNEHDVSKVNPLPSGRIRAAVREIIIHPKYDKITYDYDIALLQLDTSIDFELQNPHCKNSTSQFARMENEFDAQFVPVCLPFKARDLDLENQEGIVTGWGLTQEGGIPANSMMQATVSIFNDTACKGFYESTDIITKQMMCVGHPEGKMDSCVGDSGGPLVVNQNETYTLAGIVSWGRGCGRPNLPGVYTRMIGLTDWVKEKAADAVWCEP